MQEAGCNRCLQHGKRCMLSHTSAAPSARSSRAGTCQLSGLGCSFEVLSMHCKAAADASNCQHKTLMPIILLQSHYLMLHLLHADLHAHAHLQTRDTFKPNLCEFPDTRRGAELSRHAQSSAALSQHRTKLHARPRHRRRCCAAAAPIKRFEGRLAADPGTHIGIVVGKFNSLVTDRLLEGALAGLRATGVDENNVTIAHVPGSFELPVVATSMAQSGAHQAVICIGAVVRGATTHYEAVCNAATSGCLSAGQSSGARCLRCSRLACVRCLAQQ